MKMKLATRIASTDMQVANKENGKGSKCPTWTGHKYPQCDMPGGLSEGFLSPLVGPRENNRNLRACNSSAGSLSDDTSQSRRRYRHLLRAGRQDDQKSRQAAQNQMNEKRTPSPFLGRRTTLRSN